MSLAHTWLITAIAVVTGKKVTTIQLHMEEDMYILTLRPESGDYLDNGNCGCLGW